MESEKLSSLLQEIPLLLHRVLNWDDQNQPILPQAMTLSEIQAPPPSMAKGPHQRAGNTGSAYSSFSTNDIIWNLRIEICQYY